MKLTCPECGASVPAENINIQKMTAVCPACGAVFQFEPPQAKSKRRKVHQPSALELRDTDETLEMAFRTNFRLSQDGAFIGSALMSGMFGFMTLMMANQEVASEMLILPLGFGLATVFLLYWLATIVYNKTYIEMDADTIRVSRKPIATLDQKTEISLHGISAIRYEETAASKKEGYDLPRYNVWAETPDGNRRIIVKDVIEDYAAFIAQRLNERLAEDAEDTEMDLDVSHLEDDVVDEARNEQILNAALNASKERLKDR
jgi:hypothetical protein